MHVGFPTAEILGRICSFLSFPGSGRDVWVEAASRWWEGVRRAHVPGSGRAAKLHQVFIMHIPLHILQWVCSLSALTVRWG